MIAAACCCPSAVCPFPPITLQRIIQCYGYIPSSFAVQANYLHRLVRFQACPVGYTDPNGFSCTNYVQDDTTLAFYAAGVLTFHPLTCDFRGELNISVTGNGVSAEIFCPWVPSYPNQPNPQDPPPCLRSRRDTLSAEGTAYGRLMLINNGALTGLRMMATTSSTNPQGFPWRINFTKTGCGCPAYEHCQGGGSSATGGFCDLVLDKYDLCSDVVNEGSFAVTTGGFNVLGNFVNTSTNFPAPDCTNITINSSASITANTPI
jgi:hypothetical protein